MSTLICSLGLSGLLSVIFQAVGLFSPAWMIYSMGVDTEKLEASSGTDLGTSQDMDIDIRMGLWTVTACYGTRYGTVQQCATVSTAEVAGVLSSKGGSKNNPAVQKLLGDWFALQLLAAGAAICAGCGLVCIFILVRSSEQKVRCHGCINAVSWLLSAIFILTAVGKQATEYSTYSLGSDIVNQLDVGVSLEFHTPWAIIVSGIGGSCAAIVTLATVLYLVYHRDQEPPRDVWTQNDVEKPAQIMLLENNTG